MRLHERITAALLGVGVLGLVLTGLGAMHAPAWAWLALVGLGLTYSAAWRAAGVQRVSRKERRRAAVRVKNAAIRERRHERLTERMSRRMEKVLREVREHPGMEWAHSVAAAVRELQAGLRRHEEVLVHHKMVAAKTAADLSQIVEDRLGDEVE